MQTVDSKKLIANYSIGVVDYLGRFDDYFKPLIKSLVKIFPDHEIICVLNGHHDQKAQVEYLKRATSFLAEFPNVRYLGYEQHQPLAKCWNWVALLSQTEGLLILNDDLKVDPLFRADFEANLKDDPDFLVINGSWSHFYITKNTLRKIGWFEERLAGIGWEDGDYMLRMSKAGMGIKTGKCRGVRNLVAPATNASWAATSANEGKYAKINKDFFDQKWRTNHSYGEGDYDISFEFNGDTIKGTQQLDTPVYYDLELLDSWNKPRTLGESGFRTLWLYKLKSFVFWVLRNIKRIIN